MLILLPLLRRLSVRSRMMVGLTVTTLGLAVTATAAAVDPALLIQGIVATLVGAIFLVSARRRLGLRTPR
jgi:uncharacterized membrane protein YjjP (DUF1212 family)